MRNLRAALSSGEIFPDGLACGNIPIVNLPQATGSDIEVATLIIRSSNHRLHSKIVLSLEQDQFIHCAAKA